jgi:small subunit ribosomal protein S20
VANIASSKKDARRSAVRAARNRSLKSSVKTKVVKFRRAVAEGAEDTEQLALTAVSALDRAVSKGVLHARNAARRKSRLMKRLNAAGVTEKVATKPARATRTTRATKAAKPARATRSTKTEKTAASTKKKTR